MTVILRRRKLGLKIHEMAANMQNAEVIRHDRGVRDPQQDEHLFRWGCTANVPRGYKVVNKAAGIHLVNNKIAFRKLMDEEGGLCTQSFYSRQAIEQYDGDLSGGLVVRPCVHSRARHLYHAKTPEELSYAIERCHIASLSTTQSRSNDTWYANKYINKSAEYRVFVVNGRAVWVAKKTPANPNDVAWNVAQGGRFDHVRWNDWPLKVVKTAIRAHTLTGLDFSGVDIMVDNEGTPYVLEINSAPSQTSPHRQEKTAKAFDWIVQNDVRDSTCLPLSEQRGDWKKFGHPSLDERVWV
jgi:glutathione synthase/RimK-type ligase-like ATP-grasp enzyme